MSICKIGVVGHFGGENVFLDGQTVKTKIVYDELKNKFDDKDVMKVDTYAWRKNPFLLLKNSIKLTKNSKNIILILSKRGIRIFVPLFLFLNIFFHRKIHYVVIGAWIFTFFEQHPIMKYLLKKIDCIYVEPTKTQKIMQAIGFDNVYQMSNCKKLEVFCAENNHKNIGTLDLCIFSRILKEKGIEDAIAAVKAVNMKYGKTVATLTIYGQITKDYIERFTHLQEEFPAYVTYGGEVAYDKSTDVIKDYSAVLFPTLYFTEGHPGTVIDAYFAGVPVIASKWENFEDIIQDGITGIGYPFGENDHLETIISDLVENPEKLYCMKEKCVLEAEKYTPDKALRILISNLA